MANIKTLVGEKLLIQIGDGATPEVFTHDCLINAERGAQHNSNTSEELLIDCDDPSAPGFMEVFKNGLSISVSGGGKLHTPSVETWWNWWNSDTAKNVRIKIDAPGADGGGYIAVPMKLTQFNIVGSRKAHTTVDVTLMSHGSAAWTDNA
jgi:hypothetical protein